MCWLWIFFIIFLYFIVQTVRADIYFCCTFSPSLGYHYSWLLIIECKFNLFPSWERGTVGMVLYPLNIIISLNGLAEETQAWANWTWLGQREWMGFLNNFQFMPLHDPWAASRGSKGLQKTDQEFLKCSFCENRIFWEGTFRTREDPPWFLSECVNGSSEASRPTLG